MLPEAYPFARRDDTVVDWFRIAKVILKILLILLIQTALNFRAFSHGIIGRKSLIHTVGWKTRTQLKRVNLSKS